MLKFVKKKINVENAKKSKELEEMYKYANIIKTYNSSLKNCLEKVLLNDIDISSIFLKGVKNLGFFISVKLKDVIQNENENNQILCQTVREILSENEKKIAECIESFKNISSNLDITYKMFSELILFKHGYMTEEFIQGLFQE